MNPLFQTLVERKRYLEKLLSDITRNLEDAPQGKLRVCNDRGIPRYFQITNPNDTMRKYAIPYVISLVVGALYNIVDQIFIANAVFGQPEYAQIPLPFWGLL